MEWPLMVVAVVFLVAYSAQIVTDASGIDYERYELVLNICWAIFGIDYLVRLVTAPEKWRWFKANLIDFFSVALPFLRPLRLVRLVALLRIFQRSADANCETKFLSIRERYLPCSFGLERSLSLRPSAMPRERH